METAMLKSQKLKRNVSIRRLLWCWWLMLIQLACRVEASGSADLVKLLASLIQRIRVFLVRPN